MRGKRGTLCFRELCTVRYCTWYDWRTITLLYCGCTVVVVRGIGGFQSHAADETVFLMLLGQEESNLAATCYPAYLNNWQAWCKTFNWMNCINKQHCLALGGPRQHPCHMVPYLLHAARDRLYYCYLVFGVSKFWGRNTYAVLFHFSKVGQLESWHLTLSATTYCLQKQLL